MTTLILSFLPSSFASYFGTFPLVFAAIFFYALYKGGGVLAELSHGRTVLKLEVKERMVRMDEKARPEIEDARCECEQNFCEHGNKICGGPLDENAKAQLMVERKVTKDAKGICRKCWEKGNEYGRLSVTSSSGKLPPYSR